MSDRRRQSAHPFPVGPTGRLPTDRSYPGQHASPSLPSPTYRQVVPQHPNQFNLQHMQQPHPSQYRQPQQHHNWPAQYQHHPQQQGHLPQYSHQPPQYRQQPPQYSHQPPQYRQQPPQYSQQPGQQVHQQYVPSHGLHPGQQFHPSAAAAAFRTSHYPQPLDRRHQDRSQFEPRRPKSALPNIPDAARGRVVRPPTVEGAERLASYRDWVPQDDPSSGSSRSSSSSRSSTSSTSSRRGRDGMYEYEVYFPAIVQKQAELKVQTNQGPMIIPEQHVLLKPPAQKIRDQRDRKYMPIKVTATGFETIIDVYPEDVRTRNMDANGKVIPDRIPAPFPEKLKYLYWPPVEEGQVVSAPFLEKLNQLKNASPIERTFLIASPRFELPLTLKHLPLKEGIKESVNEKRSQFKTHYISSGRFPGVDGGSFRNQFADMTRPNKIGLLPPVDEAEEIYGPHEESYYQTPQKPNRTFSALRFPQGGRHQSRLTQHFVPGPGPHGSQRVSPSLTWNKARDSLYRQRHQETRSENDGWRPIDGGMIANVGDYRNPATYESRPLTASEIQQYKMSAFGRGDSSHPTGDLTIARPRSASLTPEERLHMRGAEAARRPRSTSR